MRKGHIPPVLPQLATLTSSPTLMTKFSLIHIACIATTHKHALRDAHSLSHLLVWKYEDSHFYLGTSLRGQALKVYHSLLDETVRDYECLMEALL